MSTLLALTFMSEYYFEVNGYIFKGSSCAIFSFQHSSEKGHLLTLLHSERPKLYSILAFLSAIGLKEIFLERLQWPWEQTGVY